MERDKKMTFVFSIELKKILEKIAKKDSGSFKKIEDCAITFLDYDHHDRVYKKYSA